MDTGFSTLDRWWRAANYLSVGQIYLMGNPLLREPLPRGAREATAARALGHHPGPELPLRPPQPRDHGARPGDDLRHRPRPRRARAWSPPPTSRAPTPRSTRRQPRRARAAAAVHAVLLPRRHPQPRRPRRRPGSIHEGGELGYALSHAYGAAFDNPDLVVAAVVGDGEAETGPLATSWHSHQVPRPTPRRRGAADPAPQRLQDRQPHRARADPRGRAAALLRGYGHTPYVVAGSDPAQMHPLRRQPRPLRSTRSPTSRARRGPRRGRSPRRPWPMIVLRSPKGWTGPKEVDGKRVEGYWRSHQVPFADARDDEATAQVLEEWMRSYGPRSSSTRRAPRPPTSPRCTRRATLRMSAHRTPTAACCCATCGCRTSATTPSTWTSPAPARSRRPACSASSCAT